MQVTAKLNNLRISPRKVRLVARSIKGMDAFAAKHQLAYIIKKSSAPISKLLDSAMANAYNNFGLVKENLFIKDISVDEGVKLKRFRPKGFGMASPIEKKTSHIRIVLEEKVPGLKAEKTKPEAVDARREETKTENEPETGSLTEQSVRAEKKPQTKKDLSNKKDVFGRVRGLGKKFFRRKAL